MRIAGVTIPDNKRIEVALTYIFGIGPNKAREILREAKIPFGKRPGEMTNSEISLVRQMVEKNKIEGDLRREISSNIKRLKEIRCYRGIRHIKRLPARGQRTVTNSRTVRGNVRMTMGSGRRKLDKK